MPCSSSPVMVVIKQRSVGEKQYARGVQSSPREQHMPKEEPQQAQNVAIERKEPEKRNRENEVIWHKALEQLKGDLLYGEAETQLTGTSLLQVTDATAETWTPNSLPLPDRCSVLFFLCWHGKSLAGAGILSSPDPLYRASEGLRGLTSHPAAS
jgi:hypothetical protein